LPGLHAPVTLPIKSVIGIWAVEGALLLGILLTVATAFGRIRLPLPTAPRPRSAARCWRP
jgi:hypothetical protein